MPPKFWLTPTSPLLYRVLYFEVGLLISHQLMTGKRFVGFVPKFLINLVDHFQEFSDERLSRLQVLCGCKQDDLMQSSLLSELCQDMQQINKPRSYILINQSYVNLTLRLSRLFIYHHAHWNPRIERKNTSYFQTELPEVLGLEKRIGILFSKPRFATYFGIIWEF